MDALEALHPGELRNILVQEIERYYDTELDERIEDVASELVAEINDWNDRVRGLYAGELEDLEQGYAALEECRKELWEQIEASLDAGAPYIDDTEWPEPADGDEDDDPLYNSARSYMDQISRYKRHQGKSEEFHDYRKPITSETIELVRGNCAVKVCLGARSVRSLPIAAMSTAAVSHTRETTSNGW